MYVKIQYNDGKYDYIKAFNLDGLLSKGRISQFYRPLSRQWVSVNDQGGIRKSSDQPYSGPEKRNPLEKFDPVKIQYCLAMLSFIRLMPL